MLQWASYTVITFSKCLESSNFWIECFQSSLKLVIRFWFSVNSPSYLISCSSISGIDKFLTWFLMVGLSMRTEKHALKDFLIPIQLRKFLFSLPRPEDMDLTCRFLTPLLSLTLIGIHRWMSRPKIERIESVRSTKCECSVSSLQPRLRRAFFRRPLTRKALMTKLSKLVCSMTMQATPIGKRSWRNLSDKEMTMMKMKDKQRVRFQTSTRSMRCWRDLQRSSSSSNRWIETCLIEKMELRGWRKLRRWNQVLKTTATTTIGWSKTGKCPNG